jgi:integrase
VEQVYAIAAAVKPWYRAMVLLAPTTGLRWGERVGLRRRHVDLGDGFVTVKVAAVELEGGVEPGARSPPPGSGRSVSRR